MRRVISARNHGTRLRLALSLCYLGLLAACVASGGSAPEAAPGAAENAPASEGELLYRQYCASCHRPLEKTNKPNRKVSRIHSAIKHFPSMNHLDHLTIGQLKALAEALENR